MYVKMTSPFGGEWINDDGTILAEWYSTMWDNLPDIKPYPYIPHMHKTYNDKHLLSFEDYAVATEMDSNTWYVFPATKDRRIKLYILTRVSAEIVYNKRGRKS